VTRSWRSSVRPGDLVRGKQGSFKGTPLVGIIIKESDRSNTWGDERHQWWTVLCEGGVLVDEVESLMEVIHENNSSR
jgi:hypothetical protein